jgi:hypothetical protein
MERSLKMPGLQLYKKILEYLRAHLEVYRKSDEILAGGLYRYGSEVLEAEEKKLNALAS